jgi:multidrug efflux pump subunit AcrA (membrane-fusion protein)
MSIDHCLHRFTHSQRRGLSAPWLLGALLVAGAGTAAVVIPWSRRDTNRLEADAVVHTVQRVMFEHSVVEPGEIESSRNVEIRCEIQSRNSTGTMILEIVPAGTIVKQGDVLIKFDGSALEAERTSQQSITSSSEALVIQSQNTYDTAVIARKEYLEGTFRQEEQLIESEVFVAEENLRRAEEYARYSEKLAARGFVTAQQLEADKFAVDKAGKDLQAAKTKLKVLREFTKEKTLKTLDAAVATAAAKLKADQRTYQLDQDKLALIEQQLASCIVKAPSAGKVVYANETDRRGNQEVVIQEGAVIRERQAVIRLPDMNLMQVKAKINESRIGFVRVGMRATITLDAFSDLRLDGVVTRVDEFPMPPGWSSGNVKQYATYVEMKDPPPGIRPGLTANVEIHVDQIPDAIAIPVHALHEHKGQYYCLVKNDDGVIEAHWVEIGASNDKQVVIKSGLAVNEKVVENPDVFVELVDFPAPPPESLGKPKTLLVKASDNPPPAEKGKEGQGAEDGAGPPGEGGRRGGRGGRGGFDPVAIFNNFDANKDGLLTPEEMPPERRDRWVAADANKDGKLDRAELTSSMGRRGGGRSGGGPGGGGPNVPAGALNSGGGG